MRLLLNNYFFHLTMIDLMLYIRTAIIVTVVMMVSHATLMTQPQPTFFRFTANTEKNATIIILKDASILVNGEPIEIGDEIGVFTPDSLCVGAGVWQDDGATFAAWENDVMTEEKDGINHGEQMHFRIWRKSVNTQYKQEQVRFTETNYSTGDDTYSTNAIYVIDMLTAEQIIVSAPYVRTPGFPHSFSLEQNYPNPFNPETTIGYRVPTESHVRITLHNLIGQQVDTIVDEFHLPGEYEVRFSGKNLPSGIYAYRMQAGIFNKTMRFILLR
jgi:hypothetical protein